ncbi:hypothetical protein [Lacrimispora sp.]|uniref:hypothetical protein n=1 Tax=Lacrimispora sp. TaxID=2719234 RepID=UPI00289EC27D|nr:hypothetical protein [Lacrimispora sp.]
MKNLSKRIMRWSRPWLFLLVSSLLISLTGCSVDIYAKKGIFRFENAYPQDMLLHEELFWDKRTEPIEVQKGLFIKNSSDDKLICFLDDKQNMIASLPDRAENEIKNLRILKDESTYYCIITIWKQAAHTLRDKAVIASDIIIFSGTGVPSKIELGDQEYALLIRGSDLYYYCKKKVYKKPLDGGEAVLLKELEFPIEEDEENYFRYIQFVYTPDQVEIYLSTDWLGRKGRADMVTVLLDTMFFD